MRLKIANADLTSDIRRATQQVAQNEEAVAQDPTHILLGLLARDARLLEIQVKLFTHAARMSLGC